ncbi:MAG: NAD-dependent protein deacylase [Eubacteriales bacterium]|nr:NAD-dependent protein deacylase [Lachnospiraceae bacterium]MDO5126427.1 NAD-dependent protein deacylase [Eubacteriales bacterium]
MTVACEKEIEKLNQAILECSSIVFFGGAGVSTESGIPDFRSVDGLYNQKYDYPPETIISHSFYQRNPSMFYQFYKDKMIYTDAKPNVAHMKLAELERAGKLKAVVTQNIDGLHQLAGSKEVLELHGSVHRNYCTKCGKFFDLQYIIDSDGVPLCDECKRVTAEDVKITIADPIIKPDVVLYEEGLDNRTLTKTVQHISMADMLIIGGTSLAVYPAAGLIDYFKGKYLVVVNMQPTPRDQHADIVINAKIGEVFSKITI